MSFFDRLKAGLARTRESFTARVEQVFRQPPGPEFYDELEAALLQGDVGVAVTEQVLAQFRTAPEARDPAGRRAALRAILRGLLGPSAPLSLDPPPAVVLVLGVNGSG